MRLGRNGQLGGSMTKTEMAVLFLSLGALALSAATLLGANSLTSHLGERLELFHRWYTALQTEVSLLTLPPQERLFLLVEPS